MSEPTADSQARAPSALPPGAKPVALDEVTGTCVTGPSARGLRRDERCESQASSRSNCPAPPAPEVLRDASSAAAMPWAYWLGWKFFRALFAVYFRWRVFHPERVPPAGPVILAPNHQSFLDPPLVGAPLRRMVSFLARESLFHSVWLGPILRAWRVIPLDREGGTGAGLKAVLERLKAGGAVLLFPEGTRSRDGQLQKARSGIGLVVVKSGAPVVPVRIFGAFEALGRQARFPRPRPLAVKYGRPLTFEPLRAEAQTCSKPRLKAIYQEVADAIMAAIAALEPGPDAPAAGRLHGPRPDAPGHGTQLTPREP